MATMLASIVAELHTLRSGIHTMYRDTGATAGRIRFEHLNSVVRLTPFAMAANVGSASLVLWAFRGQWSTGLLMWWGIMVGIAALALGNWLRFRHRPLQMVSCRGINRSTWHAALLAAAWGFMPVTWFPGASPGQQLVIATLFTGMLGAGTFVLGALPLASLAYVSLFTASSLWALASAGEPMMRGVAMLLGFYAPMVLVGGLSSWRKATAFLLSQNDAVRQEQMLAVMLQDFEQSADEALWETDSTGHLRQPSARLATLLHTSPDVLQRVPFTQWLQAHCRGGIAPLHSALAKGAPFHSIAVGLVHGNDTRHLAFNGKPLFDEWGQPAGWRGVLADRTAEAAAQEQLHRLAHTDSLTQLANRFALHAAIEAQLQARPSTAALLLLDLDHFKAINDNFGHSVGDHLLNSVARRIEEHAPAQSLIARLGGDEFAVLLRDGSAPGRSSRELADLLVTELGRPHYSGERRLRIGASIGIVDLSGDVDSVDELLVRADIALYDAKARGRSRAASYSHVLRESTRRRAAIEEGLRQAIRRQELSLHWQPKVNLTTWEVTGAEALMRWHHPVLGHVSPGEFIPIAEQSGLVELLGLWAMQRACEHAVRHLPGIEVSVNVSPKQLDDVHFVRMVETVLQSTAMPAHLLELEITESVFIDDAAAALRQLHALRGLGVRIALDDFGTGYSSLSYLCRFPFNTLKLDRSFVEEAMARSDALAVVHTITHLAQSLGMRSVCEGIETRAQLDMVRDAGIHEAQGYLLSRPMPLELFTAFAANWKAQDAPVSFLATGMAPMLPAAQ